MSRSRKHSKRRSVAWRKDVRTKHLQQLTSPHDGNECATSANLSLAKDLKTPDKTLPLSSGQDRTVRIRKKSLASFRSVRVLTSYHSKSLRRKWRALYAAPRFAVVGGVVVAAVSAIFIGYFQTIGKGLASSSEAQTAGATSVNINGDNEGWILPGFTGKFENHQEFGEEVPPRLLFYDKTVDMRGRVDKLASRRGKRYLDERLTRLEKEIRNSQFASRDNQSPTSKVIADLAQEQEICSGYLSYLEKDFDTAAKTLSPITTDDARVLLFDVYVAQERREAAIDLLAKFDNINELHQRALCVRAALLGFDLNPERPSLAVLASLIAECEKLEGLFACMRPDDVDNIFLRLDLSMDEAAFLANWFDECRNDSEIDNSGNPFKTTHDRKREVILQKAVDFIDELDNRQSRLCDDIVVSHEEITHDRVLRRKSNMSQVRHAAYLTTVPHGDLVKEARDCLNKSSELDNQMTVAINAEISIRGEAAKVQYDDERVEIVARLVERHDCESAPRRADILFAELDAPQFAGKISENSRNRRRLIWATSHLDYLCMRRELGSLSSHYLAELRRWCDVIREYRSKEASGVYYAEACFGYLLTAVMTSDKARQGDASSKVRSIIANADSKRIEEIITTLRRGIDRLRAMGYTVPEAFDQIAEMQLAGDS